MRRRLFSLAALGAGLCAGQVALAHHSAAAFDPDMPVEVTGTVSKVEWLSPHARIYVDTADDTGATVTWDFELPSPNTLMRRGWSRNALQIGDMVSVRGIRARNGAPIAIAQGVTDASGKRLFATSAASE